MLTKFYGYTRFGRCAKRLDESPHLPDSAELHDQVVRDDIGHHGVLLVLGVVGDELAHPSGSCLQLATGTLADKRHVLHEHLGGLGFLVRAASGISTGRTRCNLTEELPQ